MKLKLTLQIILCLGMCSCATTSAPKTGYGPDVILGPQCLKDPPKDFVQDLCKGNKVVDGQKQGPWCCYDLDENLRMAAEFKNGKKQGRAELYSPTGRLETVSYWEDGWQAGKQETFHANGQKELDFFLAKGNVEGSLKEYYPSGRLRSDGEYKNGQRHGIYREWDEEGCLRLEEKDELDKNIYSKEFSCPSTEPN